MIFEDFFMKLFHFRSWDSALRDLSAICASCPGFGFASAAEECACLDCPVIYRDDGGGQKYEFKVA